MAAKRTIAFVGDVMLGRGVNEELPLHPPEYFWGDTLPVLRSADAVVANLECAITPQKLEWARTPKVFLFRAGPLAIDVLKTANVQCVCLANNHILDAEEEGLKDTLKLLDEAGIRHAGAGIDLAQARQPALFEANGLSVGMIGMTDNEPAFAADAERAGTNYRVIRTEPDTLSDLQKDIAAADRAGAELLILSLHWGPNMVISPPKDFREFARVSLDTGIDLIHGHSAHIFQGVERYGRQPERHAGKTEGHDGKLIMYDTGDFLDDYAIHPILRNDWSFIFLVEIADGSIERLRMVPVLLTFAQVNLAKDGDFDQICDRMITLCKEFNTPVVKTPEGLEIPIRASWEKAM